MRMFIENRIVGKKTNTYFIRGLPLSQIFIFYNYVYVLYKIFYLSNYKNDYYFIFFKKLRNVFKRNLILIFFKYIIVKKMF